MRIERLRYFRRVVASRFALGLVAFLTLVCSVHAGQTPVESYDNRVKGAQTLAVLGPDLFGEQVNLFDGNTEFKVTDISVATNSGMPLTLGRKLKVSSDRLDSNASHPKPPALPTTPVLPAAREAASEIFGQYWDPDIPVLRGVYGARGGWISNSYAQPLSRCSVGITAPPGEYGIGQFNGVFYEPKDFWSGISLSIPGRGDEMLLSKAAGRVAPSDGLVYVGTTRSEARVTCLTTLLNATGEGFLVVLADGTRYWFNWMASHGYSATESKYCLECTPTPAVPRVEIFLYATKVEDRHGNTITYSFDPTFPHRLTTITSNESTAASPLKISLEYDASGKVETAHSGSRTWTYHYSQPGEFTELTSVTLPDSSSWTYQYNSLLNGTRSDSTRLWNFCQPTVGTMTSIAAPSAGETSSITMTHPSGATGLFEFRKLIHGTNNTPGRCRNVPFSIGVGGQGTVVKIEGIPMVWQATSLYRKTITGAGLGNQQWNYVYTPSWSWDPPSGGPTPCGPTCPISSQTMVSDPDGVLTFYQFGNDYGGNSGQLLKTTVVKGGVTARTTTNTYLVWTAAAPYPEYAGTQPHYWVSTLSSKIVPLKQVDILQDGVTFTRNSTSFNLFAQPTRITRSSTLGVPRPETRSYVDNTDLWVLSQLATLTDETSGDVVQANTYDAATANRLTESRFGQLQATMTYNADGTLSTVKDGLNQTTTLTEYKRGIPQHIAYDNGDKESAIVDDLGQITSITSASTSSGNGYNTVYQYDEGGRIKKITQPSGDSTSWAVTDRVYEQLNEADDQVGLGDGHWRSTETTGDAVSTTWYDARWRPVLTRMVDSTDAANTGRSILRRYDAQSRTTFASYPQRSIATVGATVDGVATTYDALGRVTRSDAASELGTLQTKIEYLTNFRKKVTSPRNTVTTFDYQTFDVPDEQAPIEINEPLSVKTTISRDLYGKPTAMTRSGSYGGSPISASRQYVYDTSQRLCKTIEPETGANIVNYDAADNIDWIASGQTLNSVGDCERDGVVEADKTSHQYDTRNRLLRTWYHDSPQTAETTRTWTADSQPLTVTSAGSTWTYAYNKRRLLVSESLAVASGTYLISHRYNTNGHEDQLTYPDNSSVGYTPNALGEAKQIGTYASAITRHPNGGLKGFAYANGIVHSTTQTTRGLPDVSSDSGVIDDNYNWDANGNVDGINSAMSGLGRSRAMTYDDRDRLVSASYSDPGRSYAYTYDPLDNLRTSSAPGRSYTHMINAGTQRLEAIREGSASGPLRYSYTYAGAAGDRGHVTTRTTPNAAQTFTVDGADRIIAVAGLASYGYDGNGRRTTISEPGGSRTTIYGQDGKLLYEVSSASTDRIYCNGFDGPCGSAAATTKYVYLGSHLIARARTSAASTVITYLHTDGLGSPVAETSSSGTIVSRTLHEPYGAPVDGVYVDGPGYSGHVVDSITGLSYLQARYLDPIAGRFLSVDPVPASPGHFNAYNYAGNNPFTYIDPDGRDPCLPAGHLGDCNTPVDKARGLDKASLQGAADSAAQTRSRGVASGEIPRPTNPGDTTPTPTPKSVAERTGDLAENAFDGLMNGILPAIGPEGIYVAGGIKIAGGGLLAVRLGMAGERAVRAVYDIGLPTFIKINGRRRIPDGINALAKTVSEVKNVKELGLTSQLLDYSAYARSKGFRFDLFVREDTYMTKPLKEYIAGGNINLMFIP